MAERSKPRKAGAIIQQTVREGGKVYNDWKQPGRREILKDNLAAQATSSSQRRGVSLSAGFPELDREVIRQKRPEVFQDRRELEKFLNTSEGRPYRRSPRGRSRSFSFGGI